MSRRAREPEASIRLAVAVPPSPKGLNRVSNNGNQWLDIFDISGAIGVTKLNIPIGRGLHRTRPLESITAGAEPLRVSTSTTGAGLMCERQSPMSRHSQAESVPVAAGSQLPMSTSGPAPDWAVKYRTADSGSKSCLPFNAKTFLNSSGTAQTIVDYARGARIFTQGDVCDDLLYVQTGAVSLSVLSKTGREAIVALLGPGDFFGEGCLAGQTVRRGSAIALVPSAILLVSKETMVRLLHTEHAMSDRFIANMLSRNTRIEDDLIDQRFNSSEARLARVLLRLARDGTPDRPVSVVPPISQRTLADMIGTTRSRVNAFLNKFRRLGFIEYSGESALKINSSLQSMVLHD